jgi:hypothetical protein
MKVQKKVQMNSRKKKQHQLNQLQILEVQNVHNKKINLMMKMHRLVVMVFML